MAKKNGRRRSPEEATRREKIRELLALADVNGMEDIRQLFRETIAEFIEDGLDAEMDEHLGYGRYDTKEDERFFTGQAALFQIFRPKQFLIDAIPH